MNDLGICGRQAGCTSKMEETLYSLNLLPFPSQQLGNRYIRHVPWHVSYTITCAAQCALYSAYMRIGTWTMNMTANTHEYRKLKSLKLNVFYMNLRKDNLRIERLFYDITCDQWVKYKSTLQVDPKWAKSWTSWKSWSEVCLLPLSRSSKIRCRNLTWFASELLWRKNNMSFWLSLKVRIKW